MKALKCAFLISVSLIASSCEVGFNDYNCVCTGIDVAPLHPIYQGEDCNQFDLATPADVEGATDAAEEDCCLGEYCSCSCTAI